MPGEGYAFAFGVFLPEILPTVRFRAVNSEGVEEVWYVSTNEENGSIILLREEQVAPQT